MENKVMDLTDALRARYLGEDRSARFFSSFPRSTKRTSNAGLKAAIAEYTSEFSLVGVPSDIIEKARREFALGWGKSESVARS